MSVLVLTALLSAPDIFFISVDTLRTDRLGCYGYTHDTTPHIDALAEKGLLFEDMVCEIPLTSPSMGAMMSSRIPRTTGAVRNGLPMPKAVPLVAERFQQAGYETVCVQSNWVLKGEMSGLSRGFEVYDDGFKKRRWGFMVAERRAPDVNKVALKQLAERDPDRPLFMWIHYSDPHAPYRWHRDHNPRNDRLGSLSKEEKFSARYDSEVAFTDAHIGALLEALPKENAFVVFVADHGESLNEHGYMGHGRRIYQQMMSIPFIVTGPGIEAGRTNAPARGIDLGPTLLSLAGLDPWPGMAGLNVLAERPSDARSRPIETYAGAVLTGRGSEKSLGKSNPMRQGIIAEGWKIILEGDQAELFHLAEDPHEIDDLAEINPVRAEALRKMVEEWTAAHPQMDLTGTLSDDDVDALKALGYL
jgi:arylsulfatase A-like enzyme